MMHWAHVLFAANWGFAALMLAVGYGLGWWLRGRAERAKLPWPLKIAALPSLSEYATQDFSQRADTPGPRETPWPEPGYLRVMCFYCGHGEHDLCSGPQCGCDKCNPIAPIPPRADTPGPRENWDADNPPDAAMSTTDTQRAALEALEVFDEAWQKLQKVCSPAAIEFLRNSPDALAFQRADTPGPRETNKSQELATIARSTVTELPFDQPEPVLTFDQPKPVFQTQSGQVIESPRTWDQRLARFGGPEQIPYEELEGMFLDQFLLRYFYSLMPESWIGIESSRPWDTFTQDYPWAKEMPLLFEQMTGYKLNEIQLNNAIAEWARRVSKTPKCSFCNDGPVMPSCPVCGRGNEPQRAETSVQREMERTR